MLSAGAEELRRQMGTCDPGPLFDRAEAVAAIYEAMQEKAPKSASKSTVVLKLDTSEFEKVVANLAATVAEFKAAIEAATTEE